MYYVYALVHPDTYEPFYVGYTNNPDRRYVEHVNSKSHTLVSKYINVLHGLGKMPEMDILFETEDRLTAEQYEQETIIEYGKEFSLQNTVMYQGVPPVAELCNKWGTHCGKYHKCSYCRSVEYAWRYSCVVDNLRNFDHLYMLEGYNHNMSMETTVKPQGWMALLLGDNLADATQTLISSAPFSINGDWADEYESDCVMHYLLKEEYMFPYQKLTNTKKFKLNWWIGKNNFEIKVDAFKSMPEEYQNAFKLVAGE